jgi:hypothetical protein
MQSIVLTLEEDCISYLHIGTRPKKSNIGTIMY